MNYSQKKKYHIIKKQPNGEVEHFNTDSYEPFIKNNVEMIRFVDTFGQPVELSLSSCKILPNRELNGDSL